MKGNDTIAAIATPPGDGGIAVVRVSGPDALSIADTVFRCRGDQPSHRPANTFVYGTVHDNQSGRSSSSDIDEAILLIYKAPHSYTREDVVELQGHGGPTSARRMLRRVLDAGARLAEPGEFTRRAFLSGRIDLLQAEAVMDLIRARSDRAASAAVEQLEGVLSREFTDIYDNLIDLAGDLEATLDFGDDELPTAAMATLSSRLTGIRQNLQRLLETWDEGHLLREGALVVISGSPNVGKSTLLNALLGADRAIVTDVPGTTRDTLEEQLVLDGIPMRLVDTAGLRDSHCGIEQEGIRRAHARISRADINLWVVDGSKRLSTAERTQIDARNPERCIVVINKSDLDPVLSDTDFPKLKTVRCALRNGLGVDALRTAMLHLLGGITGQSPAHASISERHRAIIHSVQNILNDTAALLDTQRDDQLVLAAGTARTALEALGEITGRTYHNELLDNIFSRFCIGK